jgi:hypothetical protein
MGKKPCIVADCCFADPVNDIAVLKLPDDVELTDAYEEFVDAYAALIIGCLPPKSSAELDGWVLAPGGIWFSCVVQYRKEGPLWLRNAAQQIVGGMSGSPIITNDGSVVGLISTGPGSGNKNDPTGPQPRLDSHLPAGLLRNAVTKRARARKANPPRKSMCNF